MFFLSEVVLKLLISATLRKENILGCLFISRALSLFFLTRWFFFVASFGLFFSTYAFLF